MPWPALALAAVVALVAAWASGPVLRQLPEPPPDAADADRSAKPTYRSLATPGFAAEAGVAAGASGAVVYLSSPPDTWLAWTALTLPAVWAVVIDRRTTWLPTALVRASWVLAAAGAVGVCVARADAASLAWSGGAALGLWLFFHLVWRLTRAVGYGDVRLVVTIGAVTGAVSPDLTLPAAFLGTVVGAAWGIVRRLCTGSSAAFPYGPALWSGPFLAALLLALGSS